MTHGSPTDLLVLHAVRLKGFAGTDALAARFDLDGHQTREELLDAEASGWVTRSAFADLAGWTLTGAGRARNETQLREELDRVGARRTVLAVHDEFLPLNTRASAILTAWQLGSGNGVRRLFRELGDLADGLRPLEESLTGHLSRFAGYHARFTRALARAVDDPAWITGITVDSCHRIWFEFHEDLVATLNLTR